VLLLIAVLWIPASLWIAWRVARFAKRSWVRALLFLVVAPLLIPLPLAEEIIGRFQFERYCESANEVKIYGTIPVGEELYTRDGKWRVGKTREETNRLNEIYESLVRWDFERSTRVPGAIPIYETTRKIYERKTGRLLAEFKGYGTRGGWLAGETPVLVRPQCRPQLVEAQGLNQKILPFDPKAGGTK
jgi:hypothetical protein